MNIFSASIAFPWRPLRFAFDLLNAKGAEESAEDAKKISISQERFPPVLQTGKAFVQRE